MPPAPLTEPASLPHEVIAWPENAGGVAALCMVAYHGTTHSSSGGTGEGETMALEHRSWTARRNRTLNHFEVTGVIPSPEERLADGAYVVTTRHVSGPCRHVFGRSVSDYRKISTEYARL